MIIIVVMLHRASACGHKNFQWHGIGLVIEKGIKRPFMNSEQGRPVRVKHDA